MTISLNGRAYRLVLDLAGRMVVTVETGPRSSRIADPGTAKRILAGFYGDYVRNRADFGDNWCKP